jgi:hypothetical protein
LAADTVDVWVTVVADLGGVKAAAELGEVKEVEAWVAVMVAAMAAAMVSVEVGTAEVVMDTVDTVGKMGAMAKTVGEVETAERGD